MIRELEPPDHHHLNAALGWWELGNAAEARRELDQISRANRAHPGVLEIEWRVFALGKNWPEAFKTAGELVKANPENPSGWIHQSYSLHEMKQTREALELLLPVLEKFPEISTIPYNLACYACQLQEVDAARLWLAKAIQIRGKDDIKSVALADPDLQPMWEEIKRL